MLPAILNNLTSFWKHKYLLASSYAGIPISSVVSATDRPFVLRAFAVRPCILSARSLTWTRLLASNVHFAVKDMIFACSKFSGCNFIKHGKRAAIKCSTVFQNIYFVRQLLQDATCAAWNIIYSVCPRWSVTIVLSAILDYNPWTLSYTTM